LLDDGQFGAALVLDGFNYAKAYNEGIEIKADYNVGNLRAYGNIAIAQQKGTDIVWSPRASLVYKPFGGTTLHAGYARYFTPPSQVLAGPTNVAAFDNMVGVDELVHLVEADAEVQRQRACEPPFILQVASEQPSKL
jgi:outer membrane receptor protein involved in Fe transport